VEKVQIPIPKGRYEVDGRKRTMKDYGRKRGGVLGEKLIKLTTFLR